MEMRLLTNMIIFLSAEAQVAVHMYSFVIISFSTIVSQRNSWQGKTQDEDSPFQLFARFDAWVKVEI